MSLQLVVTAPNKQKVEIQCDPAETFGDVKRKLEEALGVPPEKQRLLCNGKERKDAKENLGAAGVGAKSKLMLMLAPGYSMPAPPTASSASDAPSSGGPAAAAEASAPPASVEAEGELPMPAGADPAAEGAVAGIVHVRQGRNRYHVRVPQGLARATFSELAEFLSRAFLPKVPASELRFLSRGKTAAPEDALGAAGAQEASVMLLFREGFHANADSAVWLRESQAELQEAEKEIEKLGKRIEANFSNEETVLKLAEVGGIVATLRQSVDSVRVFESSLPEMRAFRESVVAADERVAQLRKAMKL